MRNRCKLSVSLPGFSCINFQAKEIVAILPAVALDFWRQHVPRPERRSEGQPCYPSAPTPLSRPAFSLPAGWRWRGGHVPASAPPPGHPGLLSLRHGLPRKGNPGGSHSYYHVPLLSSSAEACLEARPPHPVPHRVPRFLPIFELARPPRATLGEATASEPWSEQWPSRPSSKALRIGNAPGPVRTELRKPTAPGGTCPGPWHRRAGHEFHPSSDTDQQGDLAGGFPSRLPITHGGS